MKLFNLTFVPSIEPKSNGAKLRNHVEKIQQFVPYNEQIECPVEKDKPLHTIKRIEFCKEGIENEISGLVEKGASIYVEKNKLSRKDNILKVRYVLSKKNLGTELENIKQDS